MRLGLRAVDHTHRCACACNAHAAPLAACRDWVQRVVIGLTLCPWARPAYNVDSIKYVQTEAATRQGIYFALHDEVQALASSVSYETAILVTPSFVGGFLEL